MSDFGTTDHYVAAVKAAIIGRSPSQVIADISHDIRPFDISHAASVLKHVYKEFPANTVHLVAVDSMKEKAKAIAVELDGHYFVGFDSGLFSLISEQKPTKVSVLENGASTFAAKEVLAKVALALAEGKSMRDVGDPVDAISELFTRQLKVTKKEIVGNVTAIDHYGNLITNISKQEFEKMLALNGAGTSFSVRFGREQFVKIHDYFTEVESGDCFVLFNSSHFLQIGINKGNAAELLGLAVDAPVLIEFTNG